MTLKVLQEQGNRLREPYSKHLDDGILRSAEKLERIFRGSCISSIMGKDHFDERLYQKTQKTPKSEIERAKQYRKDFWKERVNQMKTLDLYLNEQLKNEEFRKEWEENQPEMDIIRAMADARISQNLTQKELAERTGINQADISKLENGTRNPSLKLLKRLADGMGMDLKLVFTPKEPQNLKLAK